MESFPVKYEWIYW